MFVPNPTDILWTLYLGPITHLCIFSRGELNNYAAHIASSFIFAFLSAALFYYLHSAYLLASVIKASILISSYLLALGGSILTYRAFSHRLRRFPGDRLDGLTKWGAVIKAQRNGQYFLELKCLHKKYGDFVRIGHSQVLHLLPQLLTQLSLRAVRTLHQQRRSSSVTAFLFFYMFQGTMV